MPPITAGPRAIPNLHTRRSTKSRIAITIAALFAPILIMILAAAAIGFAKAAQGTGIATIAHTAPAKQGTATYNDGWVDMGQAMLDAQHAPGGAAKVAACLDSSTTGDDLITCIDAIPVTPAATTQTTTASLIMTAAKVKHCHTGYTRFGYWAPAHIVKATAKHSAYTVYRHWVPTKYIKPNC
jgi:hypothetical protein